MERNDIIVSEHKTMVFEAFSYFVSSHLCNDKEYEVTPARSWKYKKYQMTFCLKIA